MLYQKQEGLKDCGVCCLYNIIRYYKGNIDIDKLRKMTKTDEKGTSIYNIIETSKMVGFKTKSYKCSINDLNSIILPAIALIKLNGCNHFVIIDRVLDDKIKIFDPIRGYINYDYDDFELVFQNIIITFEKGEKIINENNHYKDYICDLIKNNKKDVIIIIVLSFISVVLGIIFTTFIKNIFDNKIMSNSFLISLFIILLKISSEFIRNCYSIKLSNKLDYSLSELVYTKIFFLPLRYHQSRPVGDLYSKISDIYSIEDLISNLLLFSLIDILSIIIILFTFLFISRQLFIILIIMSFLFLSLYTYFKQEENKRLEELKNNYSFLNSSIIDSLSGINSIKNLNIENKILDKQLNNKKLYFTSYNKYSRFISIQKLTSNFIESYGIIIILSIGYSFVIKKRLSLGSLTMIYSLFISFFTSLNNIISLDKMFINSKLAYKRINKIVNVNEKEDGKKVLKSIDNIKFNNVSYTYDNKILSNLSFNINKNDYFLLTGNSGNGKSTIFKLLYKELIPNKGNIFINNININEIKTNSIKNTITYVSQKEYLFNDTIKNNILMFKSVNNSELNKVLKVSGLDKVLKKRNISINYMIEENGHNFSGGERQRILIARSLIRNTDFIIFDETTSELDIESEKRIISNIKTEYDKTIILISHRENNKSLFTKKLEI